MHKRGMITLAAMAAAAMFSTSASAAVMATATSPLNIRSGPGPQYSIIGGIRDHGQATVMGCIQGSYWCQVAYNGRQGWAYSKYLTMPVARASLPILTYQASVATTYPTVATTYPAPATRTVETVGVAPSTTYVVNPPETVSSYVFGHPEQPIYVPDEVAVGAALPENVALMPVPNYEYDYAYVNTVPVLVEPQSRRIVYVY